MKRSYWKQHYVLETDAEKIERHLQRTSFTSSCTSFDLIYFEEGKNAPSLLISQGSGGHAYIFAELGYHVHLRRWNVFIMPKHGGSTIRELMTRHKDALSHIATYWN